MRAGQKVERVTRFLLGLRDRRVAAALVENGFSQEDLDEGWALFRACGGELSVAAAPADLPGSRIVARLDAWQSRWFPVVRATLRRRFPDVEARLLLNLSQTRRGEAVVSVTALLGRLARLADGTARERAALALLARRGIDAERIAGARALLDELGTVAPGPADDEADREAMRRDVDALWAWYLEWSEIARSAISDAPLLRALGYRPRPGAEARAAVEPGRRPRRRRPRAVRRPRPPGGTADARP